MNCIIKKSLNHGPNHAVWKASREWDYTTHRLDKSEKIDKKRTGTVLVAGSSKVEKENNDSNNSDFLIKNSNG